MTAPFTPPSTPERTVQIGPNQWACGTLVAYDARTGRAWVSTGRNIYRGQLLGTPPADPVPLLASGMMADATAALLGLR